MIEGSPEAGEQAPVSHRPPETTAGAATKGGPIVLYDGVCNFCDASVNFIIRRDPKARFRFAALQTGAGERLETEYRLDHDALDTLVLIENGKAYTRSTAALRIMRRLGGLYPAFYAFIVVPAFVRDFFYNWFARNRYRWFGKKDECAVPGPEIRSRFLID